MASEKEPSFQDRRVLNRGLKRFLIFIIYGSEIERNRTMRSYGQPRNTKNRRHTSSIQTIQRFSLPPKDK
jgi:hypothetical protein